jgi:hypothetical protein
MRTSHIDCLKQSRLAGFFLCFSLLGGCTDVPVHQANLYLTQAMDAEQKALLSKALPLYQKAAASGEPKAVAALLRLNQGRTSIRAQAQWLQSLPLSETERQPFLVQLGLWQQLPAAEAQRAQQELLVGLFPSRTQESPLEESATSQQCSLTIQPVLSTLQSASRWLHLSQAWQQDRQLSSLAICFSTPVFVDTLTLACSEQQGTRIHCDHKALKPVVQRTGATQVLVVAGKGGASYNNGWLQLPETATLPLLRHELSHIFGFIDEYPLSADIAVSECQAGRITPNILFSKEDLPSYLARWQLSADDIELTAVNSCQHASTQAYRVVRVDSHLQHYELAMPDLYLQLMKKQLMRPEQLMPVAYYFAYLARQEQDWHAWQLWMQQAAKAGYPPAVEALADASTRSGRQSAR